MLRYILMMINNKHAAARATHACHSRSLSLPHSMAPIMYLGPYTKVMVKSKQKNFHFNNNNDAAPEKRTFVHSFTI
jgi:hypothetical protein